MAHHIKPESDDRPGHAYTDSARAIAFDDEALLDHHIEEMLGAFGDLQVLRLHAPVD
jgi:hypothetical protein